MKALRTILAAVVLLGGAMTMNAQRMSIVAVQHNARFLTDRMAYTLGIRDPFLIDEIYRINYDYIWGVNDYLDEVAIGYYYDDYNSICEARDRALRNLLGIAIWNRLVGYNYFYRPIAFVNRGWHFSIYDYDHYGPRRYYFAAPRPLHAGYAGGHFFHGMAPRGHRPAAPAPGMTPRGGAPAPGGVYHGATPHGGPGNGHINNGTPRGNEHNGINPRGGLNYNGRSYATQPQTRPQGQPQPQGGMNNSRGNGTSPRSDSNMRSSSRSTTSSSLRTTPVSNTRTSASPTRANAGASHSNSAPSRGNASGPRGGGRR